MQRQGWRGEGRDGVLLHASARASLSEDVGDDSPQSPLGTGLLSIHCQASDRCVWPVGVGGRAAVRNGPLGSGPNFQRLAISARAAPAGPPWAPISTLSGLVLALPNPRRPRHRFAGRDKWHGLGGFGPRVHSGVSGFGQTAEPQALFCWYGTSEHGWMPAAATAAAAGRFGLWLIAVSR